MIAVGIIIVFSFVCLCAFLIIRPDLKGREEAPGTRPQIGDGLREDRKNREKYSRLTPELLDATPDEDLIKAVLFNLWGKMRPDRRDAKQVLEGLSAGRQAVYALYAVTGGLKTDGSAGFMKGPDAAFLPDALRALELLGCGDTAALLREVAPGSDPAPYLESFDALDVRGKLAAYIRQNAGLFTD